MTQQLCTFCVGLTLPLCNFMFVLGLYDVLIFRTLRGVGQVSLCSLLDKKLISFYCVAVYKNNSTLIPKNASVIVYRVPAKPCSASSTQKSW